MKAAANCTIVTGTLRACTPATDGYGSQVEIEVAANASPDPGADFIKPEAGRTLQAFVAPAPEFAQAATLVGRHVEATLTYLGGPAGGRAVVQQLKAR